MYTVYILKNGDGKLYIEQTAALEKRLKEHHEDHRGYTAKYRPWRLLWSKTFSTRRQSMKAEKYLKTGVGRDWVRKNILGG